jgi:hypothetical protein
MKQLALLAISIACASVLSAQQQTYDLLTFTPPKGWKKTTAENTLAFDTINKVRRTWSKVALWKSTTSKGSVQTDFESEWQELAVKPYQVSSTPLAVDTLTIDGWKVQSGLGKFVFNKDTATLALTTFSDGQRYTSVMMMTNGKGYADAIERFLSSIKLPQAGVVKNTSTQSGTPTPSTTAGFAFHTTNFDDGWNSVAKEDWVEVTKGSLKVFIHYPREGTVFPADPDVLTNAAWNILVAPRYTNLRNYKTTYISDYNRPILGMGTLTDNTTRKDVYVVFYRQGQTGWLEFVSPNKNAFIQEFRFDPETIQWDSDVNLMKSLEKMVGYNKFAIAASDFTGTWTSDFAGVQQMYHVYTGNYAGMNITQSNEEFVFGANNTYNWKILLTHGMVGAQNISQAKSSGTFSVLNNWQIRFSKIESGPKTFHAYWSCIKGARLLNLLDANTPGSGIYTVYGKK